MANYYGQELSHTDKLFGTTALSPARAVMIKQTYMLLSLSVVSAIVGGYIGSGSETLARFFTGWIGWIVSLVMLNVIPYIAISARHNPVLGVSALIFDGFLSGIVLSPILFFVSRGAPDLIFTAMGITALIFLAVSVYVMTSSREFSAPKGLMIGLFAGVMGAILLNSFLHIGVLGIVIAIGIGIMGVCMLVYATSDVLHNQNADSPIPGALYLFAGLFNIFVAVLNLLLSLNRSRD